MTSARPSPTSTEEPVDVVVIGNITIDDVIRADGTVQMASLGGDAIHAATAARIWGLRVGVVARMGEDLPAAVIGRLRDAGISTLGMRPIAGPTVRNWVLYEEDGSRTWVYRTPPGRSLEVAPAPSDVPAEWLSGTSSRVVHVAAMPLAAAAGLIGALRGEGRGAVLMMDTHEEWCSDRERLLGVAREVDVLLPSREELEILLGYDDPERACAELIEEKVPAVIVKCGAAGALVATPEAPVIRIPAPEVAIVDATGAGDSFCGGVAAGLALGEGLVASARRGAATAGAALGRTGSLRLLGRESLARRLLDRYEEPPGATRRATEEPEDDYDISLMLREIETIPAVIRDHLAEGSSEVAAVAAHIRERGARHLLLVGCGDSYFAAKAAELAFNRHAGLRARASHALDFARYDVRYLPDDAAVVALSFSGETGRTIEAAQHAITFGHPVIALTHDAQSRLAKSAKHVLPLDVPTSGTTPGTSTYIAMLVRLLTLARALGDPLNEGSHELPRALATLADLAQVTISGCEHKARLVAQRLHTARIVTFLGAGPNEASAGFGAAKLFEGAQQLASATNVEEWAHEQYFTTRRGDPVVLVAPTGAASDRVGEVLSELAYIGATAIVISDQVPPEPAVHLPTKATVPEELSPVLAALPLCRVGYELAVLSQKRSYNFDDEDTAREHYETIHRASLGTPA